MTKEQVMIYLNGRDKPGFRCECGCNVFTKAPSVTPGSDTRSYTCNSCSRVFNAVEDLTQTESFKLKQGDKYKWCCEDAKYYIVYIEKSNQYPTLEKDGWALVLDKWLEYWPYVQKFARNVEFCPFCGAKLTWSA